MRSNSCDLQDCFSAEIFVANPSTLKISDNIENIQYHVEPAILMRQLRRVTFIM